MRAVMCSASRSRYPAWGNMSRSPTPRATASACSSPSRATGTRRSRRSETTMIRVSAFRWVPPFARGLVRDLRVRWALREAGLPYEERLIGPEDQMSESYRGLQPFGQVPAYEEDGLVLFESGAIVLHVAERSEALMPSDPKRRARVTTWMFAALNTMEPRIQNLAEIDLFHAAEAWAKLRRPAAVEAANARLASLAGWLGGAGELEGPVNPAE